MADHTRVTAYRDTITSHVTEARGQTNDGNRVFGVRLIAYGDSKNRRRYPESVLRNAATLYQGCKAYDHHRTDQELQTSTIRGLVGWYENVQTLDDGLYADLHLLPGATHTAEALDASLAAQARGLPPLIGISHDVVAEFKAVGGTGRRSVQEAVKITRVSSADIVADPAAGGYATRAVAGGTDPADAPALHDQDTRRGVAVIESELVTNGFTGAMTADVLDLLPRQFTEAQLHSAVRTLRTIEAKLERQNMTIPSHGGATEYAYGTVGQEARDLKVKALETLLDNSPQRAREGGYRSLRTAYLDVTGARVDWLSEDLNRRIMRDSIVPFDSGARGTEAMDSTSWAQVLGDSITRRMMAEYQRPQLQLWREIVSEVNTGMDFRTQRRPRIGGYGTLPGVNQGAPYQPLTSPPDEEATYAITKRGGTEELTLEMIANDDINSVRLIPIRLGRAAANTLFRFVFDLFPDNDQVTYDSTPLFDATHANTDASAALSQTTLTAGRKKMRKQAAYGDSADLLSFTPRFLIVPTDLEETAFQLTQSVDAIPSTSNDPADRPNINYGVTPLVIDYYSDADDWYLVADPAMCPTIELGFYGPSDQPELFTQSDPTQGSMFDADKLTYKVRHIYSGAVLDHRAFYRGQGA